MARQDVALIDPVGDDPVQPEYGAHHSFHVHPHHHTFKARTP